MKIYNAENGVSLDPNFLEHRKTCDSCQRIGPSTGTLSLLCLEGSVLWKADNTSPVKRGGGVARVTRARLAEVTRYK